MSQPLDMQMLYKYAPCRLSTPCLSEYVSTASREFIASFKPRCRSSNRHTRPCQLTRPPRPSFIQRRTGLLTKLTRAPSSLI